MIKKTRPLSLALSSAAVLTLSACGGGGSGGSTGTPSSRVTLTGTVVVDQAIRNALVCLDLNANNACDAGEPVAEKTGANGAYSLAYDPVQITGAQAAGASLIAMMVPGAATDATTTIDAADPTASNATNPYVLKQTPGKSGQINPLTTLVAAGMAEGMSEEVARANVSLQLAISDTKIDNYQDDPAVNKTQMQDNARVMARIVASALDAGATLSVSDRSALVEAAEGDLAKLSYTDSANYFVRTFDVLGKSEGGPVLIADARSARTNGIVTTDDRLLYTQAYLSSAGWVYCNAAIRITTTGGNPSRSTYCNVQESVGFTSPVDIAGQSMSSVVSGMQSDPDTNPINNGVSTTALLAALGAAVFPDNASIQHRTNQNLNSSIYISDINADGLRDSITSLEQVISDYPSAAVNLSTGRGTLGLGLGSSATRVLRVAFSGTGGSTSGDVQFYECDWNTVQNTISNCTATQTGTYAISTVGGVRVMRYSGSSRMHAEVIGVPGVANGSRVFSARETTSATTSAKRLNPTAWSSMRAMLGL